MTVFCLVNGAAYWAKLETLLSSTQNCSGQIYLYPVTIFSPNKMFECNLKLIGRYIALNHCSDIFHSIIFALVVLSISFYFRISEHSVIQCAPFLLYIIVSSIYSAQLNPPTDIQPTEM